ncbi:unnamed protein product [Xylocopa violacea]|uniref:Heparanase n=1 Tax=Xylocopa violacea TaxID=135666 RepID=A0ABP1NEG7_XYLVO
MSRPKESFLLLLVLAYGPAIRCLAEEVTLNVDLRKPVALTDERFLSLTVDPVTLLAGNALSEGYERSRNLAKALTPAYIRFGGPRGAFSQFASEKSQDGEKNGEKIVLSESDWILSNQWARTAGFDVIACISPDNRRERQCQTRCNLSAVDFAKQTVDLRKVLNEFPRYSNSIVTGPDVVAYRSEEQRSYLRNYFSVASPALSAITWHPDFASVTLDNDGAFVHPDNLERDKTELYKVVGDLIEGQPLWIAESKSEECKDLFIGALVLARRLGTAAKLNINVMLRQPMDLTQPTPDYWVSLLHKTLVGREVFDANVQTSKKDHVYLYCQCAKASNRYEKGSVIIFGANLSPETATIYLKGHKINMVHKYILSPGFDAPNRMFAKTALLNNESLTLINDTVPSIHPEILSDPKRLNLHLQPGDIGFWVLPNLKVKACMENDRASKGTPSSPRVPQNLREAEDLKVHVTRSVQDQIRSETRKQRNSALACTSSVKRELRRLKKFVKKKLNDYESRSPASNDENSEVPMEPRDEVQSKLQEFKDSLSKLRDLARSSEMKAELRKSISNLVTDAISLISKVQTTLGTEYESKLKSLNDARESLKTLHDFLININVNESINSKKNKVDQEQRRTRRDLFAEIEQALNLRRENLLRKRTRNENVKKREGDRKIERREDIRKGVRPSVVRLASSDSGENTFYGFFETDSLEGFPEGDVYFRTVDSSLDEDYDYGKDEEARRDRGTDGDRRKKPSEVDYDDVDHMWAGDGNDYPFYESVEFVENSRRLDDGGRVNWDSSAELWDVQNYESRQNDEFDSGTEFEIVEIPPGEHHKIRNEESIWGGSGEHCEPSTVPKNHRPTYKPVEPIGQISAGKTNDGNRHINYDLRSVLKGLDFSIAEDYQGNKRSKREKGGDIQMILNQEMIDEDDANSKDCNCRVVRRSRICMCRSKREAIESLESKADLIVPKKETYIALDKDIAHSTIREDENVEVFAELRDSPLDKFEVQTESSNAKIARDAETTSRTEQNPGDIQERVKTPLDSNIPALESRSDLSGYRKEMLATSQPFASNLKEQEDSVQALKSTIRRDENHFFRDHPKQTEEKKTPTDTAEHTSNDQTYFAPSIVEKIAQAKAEASKTEAASVESTSAPFKATTLPEEAIRKESESNYDKGNAAEGSTKRETILGRVSQRKPEKVEAATNSGPSNGSSGGQSKKGPSKVSSRSRSNVARPRESQLSKRVRALKALRDLFHKLRESNTIVSASKLRSANRIAEHQRNRDQQVERLKGNLRDKRRTMLQRYQDGIREMVDKEKDEEKRSLKRREAWEIIKNRDDYQDMIDREKLAYVLMHQLSKHNAKEDYITSDERMEEAEVPMAKIIRAKNTRQRIFNPENRKSFHGATIVEHPNPDRLKEKIVQLTNLYRNQALGKGKFDADNKRNDKTYFALVEDVGKPRMFHYQRKPGNEEKEVLQGSSPRSHFYGTGYTTNQLQQRTYHESLKAAQRSSEEDREESDELPGDGEIYIIDPYEYKEGDLPLELYKGPTRSRTNSKSSSRNTYEIVWEPISYRPYKIRRTDHRKRENDAAGTDFQRLPKNTAEILKILIDNLDTRTAEELYKLMMGRNVARDGKDEGKTGEEQSGLNALSINEEERSEEISESKVNFERSEFPEMVGAEVDDKQQESYRDVPLEKGKRIEEDIVPEAIVAREDTVDDLKEDSKEVEATGAVRKRRDTSAEWLPSFLVRKVPETSEKTRRNNYLCLKQSSEESSDESPSELLKIITGNEYYRAVPVKRPNDKTSTSLSKRSDDDSRKYRNFLRRLKIVIPSTSSVESIEANPIVVARNPYGKLFEDASDSAEKGLELEKSVERSDDVSSVYGDEGVSSVQEVYNTDGSEDERSDDNVDLRKMLLSSKPEVLMVLPWTKRSSRLPRETTNQAEINKNSNAEKVQPSELQHLDGSTSTNNPIVGRIDDVEKSLIQKIPLEKFKTKENINKRKNARRNKKDDGLASLIEKSIPKLGNVVVDGLKKAQNFTGSVEQLIENLDEDYNKTMKEDQQRNSTDSASMNPAKNAFHSAIMNVKKFFILLSGITHILRGQ